MRGSWAAGESRGHATGMTEQRTLLINSQLNITVSCYNTKEMQDAIRFTIRPYDTGLTMTLNYATMDACDLQEGLGGPP